MVEAYPAAETQCKKNRVMGSRRKLPRLTKHVAMAGTDPSWSQNEIYECNKSRHHLRSGRHSSLPLDGSCTASRIRCAAPANDRRRKKRCNGRRPGRRRPAECSPPPNCKRSIACKEESRKDAYLLAFATGQ